MSPTQQSNACIQYEAARELAEMVRPLVGKLIHSARSLRQTDATPEAIQTETPIQAPVNRPIGGMEAQRS